MGQTNAPNINSELLFPCNFRYLSDGDKCNTTVTPSPSRNRSAVMLAVSIVAPVLVVAILFLAYLIWRAKKRPNSA